MLRIKFKSTPCRIAPGRIECHRIPLNTLFRQWICVIRKQAVTWASVSRYLYHHLVLQGDNEFRNQNSRHPIGWWSHTSGSCGSLPLQPVGHGLWYGLGSRGRCRCLPWAGTDRWWSYEVHPVYKRMWSYLDGQRQVYVSTWWWLHDMEVFFMLLALCERNQFVDSLIKGQWCRTLLGTTIMVHHCLLLTVK